MTNVRSGGSSNELGQQQQRLQRSAWITMNNMYAHAVDASERTSTVRNIWISNITEGPPTSTQRPARSRLSNAKENQKTATMPAFRDGGKNHVLLSLRTKLTMSARYERLLVTQTQILSWPRRNKKWVHIHKFFSFKLRSRFWIVQHGNADAMMKKGEDAIFLISHSCDAIQVFASF